MQSTSLHLGFQPDERAAVFSEAFFQEAYAHVLSEQIDLRKRMRELSIFDLLKKHFEGCVSMGLMTGEECRTKLEDARAEDAFPKPPINEAEIEEKVRRRLEYNQEYYRRLLPAALLEQIADLRVLALGVATQKVIDSLCVFCEENKRYVENVFQAYHEHWDTIKQRFPEHIAKSLSLHDVKIKEFRQMEGTLTLLLGKKCNLNRVRSITFHDYEIVRLDDVAGFDWGWEELDLCSDGRYAVGILCTGPENRILEVLARDITFNMYER